MNEVNAGSGGGPEFIELVVTGPSCELVDISGWIIDDNNGDFIATCPANVPAGFGVAPGYVRFANHPTWTDVSPGTIIVIFENDGTSSDTEWCTDYLITTHLGEAGLFEEKLTSPFGSGARGGGLTQCQNRDCATAIGNSAYDLSPPFNPVAGDALFGSVQLRNDGDAAQVRMPNSNYYHGISWGTSNDQGCSPVPTFSGGPDGLHFSLSDNYAFTNFSNDDFRNFANWRTSGSGSPGQANSTANANWITAMRFPVENEVRDVNCNPDLEDFILCVGESDDFVLGGCSLNDYDWVNLDPTIISIDDNNNEVEFTGLMEGVAEIELTISNNYPGLATIGGYNGLEETFIIEVTVEGFTAEILNPSGDTEICQGSCVDIELNTSIGSGNYLFDIIPSSDPAGEFESGLSEGGTFTICLDGAGGSFPTYDNTNNIYHLPISDVGTTVDFQIDLIEEVGGCPGVITGSPLSFDLVQGAPASDPNPQEICDEGGGMATFNLTDSDDEVNGGSGLSVTWFSDAGATMFISNPVTFASSSTTVYAQIGSGGCSSNIVEMDLTVLNGNAGMIEFSSSVPDVICDTGAPGANIPLDINVPSSVLEYEITYDLYVDGTTTRVTETVVNGSRTINYPMIMDSFSIEIVSVNVIDSCPFAGSSNAIERDVIIPPDILDVNPVATCGYYILPDLELTSGEGTPEYFTEMNGEGTSLSAGDTIFSTTTLYGYAGESGCADEIMIDVDIESGTVIDDLLDIISCDSLALPVFTGLNINPEVGYFTEPDGLGTRFLPGQSIYVTDTLFPYDTSAMCNLVQDTFIVVIEPTPDVEVLDDFTACNEWISDSLGLQVDSFLLIDIDNQDTLELGSIINSDRMLRIIAADNACFDSIDVDVILTTDVEAGIPMDDVLCNNLTDSLRLFDFLSGTITPGGKWEPHLSTTLVPSATSNVPLNESGPGIYNFNYVVEEAACGTDTAFLTLEIVALPEAGLDTMLTQCGGILDLESLLRNNGATGVFLRGPLDTIFDFQNYDLSAQVDPSLDIMHVIPDNGCGSDMSIIRLTREDALSAGRDSTLTICGVGMLSASSLLNGADNGVFRFSGEEKTDSILSIDNEASSITFTYFVDGGGLCPSDEASFTINTEVASDAGQDSLVNLCGVQTIDLQDYVTVAGGTFQTKGSGTELSSTQFEISGNLSVDYFYIVDGGCRADTAEVGIRLTDIEPIIYKLTEPILCEDDCTTVSLTINAGMNDVAFTVENLGTGIVSSFSQTIDDVTLFDICNTIDGTEDAFNLEPDQEYIIRVDSVIYPSGCIDFPADNELSISTSQERQENISDVLCFGQSRMIGGELFDENRPDGVVRLPGESVAGCDSVIVVDLEFQGAAINEIRDTLCGEETRMVNGVTYSASFPMAMDTLFGMASGGCDSIIIVDFTISDHSITEIREQFCDEESFIEAGGQRFDINNLSGTITLPGASVTGCDSIIDVELVYGQAGINDFARVLCDPEFEVEINGVTYDIGNPSGTDLILGGASSGCDSLIFVELDFRDVSIEMITPSLCPDDFIEINNVEYSIDKPSGRDTLVGMAQGGCDSIIVVEVMVLEESRRLIRDTFCDPEGFIVVAGDRYDSSQVDGIITFQDGNAMGCDSIIDILLTFLEPSINQIDRNSCDADFSLDVEGQTFDIDNPSGEVVIPSASANGCDSTILVNLTFDEPMLEMEVGVVCPDETTVDLTFTASNLTLPISYEMGSVVGSITELPFTLNVPVSEIGLITYVDVDNCSSNEGLTGPAELTYTLDITSTSLSAFSYQLRVEADFDYDGIMWTPTEGLSCTDCSDPIATLSEDVLYTFSATTSDGCPVMDTISLRRGIEVELVIPNIFSPNDDGINDRWVVYSTAPEATEIISAQVYDRWGNQVYFNDQEVLNNPNQGWDGRYNSAKLNPGVYVYLVQYRDNNGQVLKRGGDLTIIR